MNATTAAVMSCFALGLGGVSAFLAFGPANSPTPVQAANDAGFTSAEAKDLTQSVDELRRELAALKDSSELATITPRTSAGAVVSDEAIARAVAAYMEGTEVTPAAVLDENQALGSASEIADLLAEAGDLSSVELWKRIVEEGRDAEVLAHLKAIADASPNDPEAQLSLGQGYLGRTQVAGASPLAGKYATLADQAFDAALEADPEHWEARFTKATALSFWPPVFGKQASAIKEFETLITQQSGQAPDASHASTHLLLGNMYHQTGQTDKALATWGAGLELFPDNADLASQLAILSGQ
jgi:tetratricopeptide (TPR) repeat protein